jgi:hypothetical protein
MLIKTVNNGPWLTFHFEATVFPNHHDDSMLLTSIPSYGTCYLPES